MGVLGKKGGFMCGFRGPHPMALLSLRSWRPLSSQSGKEMGRKNVCFSEERFCCRRESHPLAHILFHGNFKMSPVMKGAVKCRPS